MEESMMTQKRKKHVDKIVSQSQVESQSQGQTRMYQRGISERLNQMSLDTRTPNRIPLRSATDVPLLVANIYLRSRVHTQIILEAHCQIAASSSILVLHPLTDAT